MGADRIGASIKTRLPLKFMFVIQVLIFQWIQEGPCQNEKPDAVTSSRPASNKWREHQSHAVEAMSVKSLIFEFPDWISNFTDVTGRSSSGVLSQRRHIKATPPRSSEDKVLRLKGETGDEILCNTNWRQHYTNRDACFTSFMREAAVEGSWRLRSVRIGRSNALISSALLLLQPVGEVETIKVLTEFLSEQVLRSGADRPSIAISDAPGRRGAQTHRRTPHGGESRQRRQRAECGPNLLKINTRQYQHLVWHVLVISFSLLSVFV